MRKQELIHLHSLLAQVQVHYEEESETEVQHDEYATLGVKPTSIHKSKTDHKDAVFALADGIINDMAAESDETRTLAAD
ncbi:MULTISPECIES: UPF0058 family protein [Haloarcula]|uniref:UPF0058 family protein n=1 Tax=Haloarcula TaxID=2237 RepID=UPI0023E3C78E|nr:MULTISPECIES: UPF0058 family protein [Haloarculaceae]